MGKIGYSQTRKDVLEKIEFLLMDMLDEGIFVTVDVYSTDTIATANAMRGGVEDRLLDLMEKNLYYEVESE